MPVAAKIEVDIGNRTFASGLLFELITALRRSHPGELLVLIGDRPSISRYRNLVSLHSEFPHRDHASAGRTRWVLRYGEAPDEVETVRPLGSRLWLYTNFDCNLRCDYCCVRSSPKAPRRALGLERVRRIASEAQGSSASARFS